ncbi:MAG: tetratricopeptide repeat protein, partial [Thiohalocapsa sp.]
LNPQAIEPPLQLARLRVRQGRSAEAAPFFETVLAREPEHAEALSGLGQALAEVDPGAALAHFQHWAGRCPEDLTPRLQLARLYQAGDDWQQAQAIYLDVLERDPHNKTALSRLVQLLSAHPGGIERALAAWRNIAEHRAADPLPLVQQAQLLERMRRPEEAERAYRSALARAAGDAAASFGLARLLSNQGQWQAAAALFEAVLRANPARSDALLGLGRCLERLDRDEEALAAYDKVLAGNPKETTALLYRSRLLRQLGRVDAAIEAWREVARRDPGNADAYHELVFTLASAEREPEALEALAQAEAALPPSPSSWIRLALAAQAGQLHEQAIAYFERAIAAEPQEASHHAQLGQYYLSQGIVDGAFDSLLASRERNPADVTVARRLVEAVKTLNDVGVDHLELHRVLRRERRSAVPRIGKILVPERLFHVVRRLAETEVAPYVPVPRRIVAVSASLAPGGAERQLANMLRGLSEPRFGLDLALCVISLGSRGRRNFFLPLLAETPVDIATVDEAAVEAHLRAPETAPYARLIGHFPAQMIGPIACWLAEFRRRRPQVVHAWQDSTNLTAAVAALLAGVPRIVLCSRSIRPSNPRRTLRRYMQEAYQVLADHPAVVLSNNSRAGADDHADWLGLDRSRIQVVYNGVDFDTLEQTVDRAVTQQARDSLGIPADAPLLGGVFRMSEEKRPLLWVEVAAAVARQDAAAHFVICGDGPMRSDMEQLAASLGIADRFHFAGTQPNIASWYKAMDVVMLTSRYEGLPNVPLEAQSLGVPIVAPDVGGMGETIWNGVTGWTVRDAGAAALAERVVFCFRDRAWTANAAQQAPVFVRERFGIEAMLRRNLEVYGIPAEPSAGAASIPASAAPA